MPTPINTVYIIHNSHTDIGFTHPQPVVWERHRRSIDRALELAWTDRSKPIGESFRWTIETTALLMHWLRYANAQQRERLRILNQEGRMDVGGMFLNLTPLCDTAELISSMQPVAKLRHEVGLNIRYAMNCDINGQNWPLADILLDAGFSGFAMGINEAWGGAPLYQPCPFWWESPSGRRLLVWNGWIYGYVGRTTGLSAHDADKFASWWPHIEAYLAEHQYPLPILMIQVSGDNIVPNGGLPAFITAWNAAGKRPHLRMSTLSEWMDTLHEHLTQEQAVNLPVLRGDWTDFWNFGCISSAREQGMHRESRTRLLVADSLRAVAGVPVTTSGTHPQFGPNALREEAFENLLVYDEHTWGASGSIREPEAEETRVQWAHKAAYAAQARSLSSLLLQDGLSWLGQRAAAETYGGVLVFNPLPWERTVAGPVAGSTRDEWIAPTKVPGFGYKRVQLNDSPVQEGQTIGDAVVIENHRHRITFDQTRGGICSWWDKSLGRELVDQDSEFPLAGFVHEEVADRNHPWPRRLIWSAPESPSPLAQSRDGWHPQWQARRTQPTQQVGSSVSSLPWATEVEQVLSVPNLPKPIKLKVRLPVDADYVECIATWEMGQETYPEATYLAFPFAIPQADCHFDVGPQAVQPEHEQLPGSCRDYFTVQRWVDFSNNDFGITVACPINPMMQLGGFHFGANQERFTLDKALLLGWITNNYWGTNFRAHQPGEVIAHYRLLPHDGPFCEVNAHHFGLEASTPCFFTKSTPQSTTNAPCGNEQPWPAQGTLISLPTLPTVVLHVRPGSEPNVVLVNLIQASDEPGVARLGPGILKFSRAIRCDIFGQQQEELTLQNRICVVPLQGRMLATIRLEGVELLNE